MPTDIWSEFHGANLAYVADLYERYAADPEAVDPEVRRLFAAARPPGLGPVRPVAEGTAAAAVDAAAALKADALLRAVRRLGHRSASLDPLTDPAPDVAPEIAPAAFGLTETALAAIDANLLPAAQGVDPGASALEAYRDLVAVYAQDTIAYEFEHVEDEAERRWLSGAARDASRRAMAPEGRRRLLERLAAVEALERYLQGAFPGVKRFSIEGLDALVPMLDRLVDRAGAAGARRVAIGMAHRGRLNVLAHVLSKPYADIVADFAGHDLAEAQALAAKGRSGDVKYHVGWRSRRTGEDGRETELWLCNNPSHLELVDPVVEGVARAAQDDRTRPGATRWAAGGAMAIAVHGDAAFPGEGVVAETLNLSRLTAYDTGGTIHIIGDNGIGFTTDPSQARSTARASDLAKGYDLPVVHVNADDPEACLAAVDLAFGFRERFGRSILVDLVGYRRWGHNEGDEPAFTQPLLYARVRAHPTVRSLYAGVLEAAGVVTGAQAATMADERAAAVARARETSPAPLRALDSALPEDVATAVTEVRLAAIGEALSRWPGGFSPHERLSRTLARRADAFGRARGIDWGFAETLALATLLEDGVPIRLTGQDAERGTFAQRNLVLHDATTGATYAPLAHLPTARASVTVANSPLSETAAMGFEYGYSVAAPEALVLWEAQYGDFANMAQPIVDQFLTAARAKWAEASGLVLLLPHGYEGQGPEHSSARLERYLQLAAEHNLTVAYPSRAGQYFHLLRLQAQSLGERARPLVVMTPKSLLRHPLAGADLGELANGRFEPVLDETAPGVKAAAVERLVLAAGKVAVDCVSAWADPEAGPVAPAALVRLERLYPFPQAELARTLARYPKAREAVWLQEEPRNMGAWTYVAPCLRSALGEHMPITYVGPAAHAAPATGVSEIHAAEMRRIVAEALGQGERTAPVGEARGRS